jgi:glycosyltransferase involved in cell wall biosynthesis
VAVSEQLPVTSEPATKHADYLVVANAYPSEAALYRNGFIHRRVKGYQEAGLSVEVFYLHPPRTECTTYEFDGVRVTLGNAEDYSNRIATVGYRAILVHFASPAMIEPVRRYAPTTPVVLWVHGFEAEAWHRRWFDFVGGPESIRAALARKSGHYADQLAFMAWLLSTDELDLHVVHVSEWFRRNVVEPDTGVQTDNAEVIPNVVDTDLFAYRAKDPAARARILSVRPYASRKYANDLMIRAILELSRRPFFGELRFTIRGDGALFDRTVAPVLSMDNVDVAKGFLRQEEIAQLHAEHGVFLVPTRFDSQGVSMCEAMSSGLVPVATAVAAVPEFVEHRATGLLAAAESATGLADAIEALYYNEELFARLSLAANESIRDRCRAEVTVGREIGLIRSLR